MLEYGWFYNGLLLNFGGDFALFPYPPLIKLKIALFVKTPPKAPLEFEQLLQIVRLSHHTCQVSYKLNHEILKQICFEKANTIAVYGKIGLDYKHISKLCLLMCLKMGKPLFDIFIKKRYIE